MPLALAVPLAAPAPQEKVRLADDGCAMLRLLVIAFGAAKLLFQDYWQQSGNEIVQIVQHDRAKTNTESL